MASPRSLFSAWIIFYIPSSPFANFRCPPSESKLVQEDHPVPLFEASRNCTVEPPDSVHGQCPPGEAPPVPTSAFLTVHWRRRVLVPRHSRFSRICHFPAIIPHAKLLRLSFSVPRAEVLPLIACLWSRTAPPVSFSGDHKLNVLKALKPPSP